MYPIDARLVIQVKCVFVRPAGEYVGTDFQVKETPRGRGAPWTALPRPAERWWLGLLFLFCL